MLWSAFILGLISSLHCVGMCAPLQLSVLGFGRAKAIQPLLYHLGRLISYLILGLMAALVGKSLGVGLWQHKLSLLAGLSLALFLIAYYIFGLDKRLSSLLLPYFSRIRGHIRHNYKSRLVFYLSSGMINGLLPCGMVYLAISGALVLGDAKQASLYMLLFGLGTLPLLYIVQLNGGNLLKRLKPSWSKRLIPILLATTAALLIIRGMQSENLHNFGQQPAQVSSCK